MNKIFTTLILLILFGYISKAQVNSKPNVLVIYTDDHRYTGVHTLGGQAVKTPHLDKLAADGLRFSQFYNTAKCHSSRVDLLTGLYCGQAGNAAMDSCR